MPGLPNKNDYQVLSRRYRPQTFYEVLGQEAIVTTLKNGMKQGRLAHAYLFSGPRGTGKTTLARLLSKAINCLAPTSTFDPCNACSSCKEIGFGTSLDVIEIDGASNRGIDDIRQINETVGYSTSSGKYKIYIIDEVHMLTKEAFNALLKTLEEPPPTVKFFFATTEPHKIPPTVLSRCQQFQLKHLKTSLIIQKLSAITSDQNRKVDFQALSLIAAKAGGGLRDAESLLDQLLSYHEGEITEKEAADSLGLLPQEIFFQMDQAGKDGHLAFAFEVAGKLFEEGKDPGHFVESLVEHFRNLVLIKLAGANSPCLEMGSELKSSYIRSAEFYEKHQLLSILELSQEATQSIRFATSPRIALEGLLLKILRSYKKIPLDLLVERLMDLEKSVQGRMEEQKEAVPNTIDEDPAPPLPLEPPKKSIPAPIETTIKPSSISEDPTPLPSDLPRKMAAIKIETPKETSSIAFTPRDETILQFAAVELEGKIVKK